MQRVFFFLFLLYPSTALAQAYQVKGRVVDSKTKEPLAFVNIIADNQKQGTVSDIDGKFEIVSSSPVQKLLFSYVGYELYTLNVADTVFAKPLTVALNRKSYELKEVTIVAGENPAHRIIRKVTENRDRNNPEKMRSFSYTSYNKMIFAPAIDSALINESQRNTLDSADKKIIDFTEKQHIFLMESVSERIFRHPGRSYEKVIASRVSGLKDPAFTLLATQMQSFSFYDDYITIYEKKYLNPVAPGSTSKYFFLMEDTLYSAADTVFIISYRPRKDKNFEGMKGLLYVNTNGYALQNVIARPAEKADIEVKIQQQYELVDGRQWFPVQLNTDITYHVFKVNNFSITGIGRSYLKDIKLEPEIKSREFGPVAIEIDPEAGNRDEAFWNKYRNDTLSAREVKTYQVVDSIGEAENLDLKLKFAEALLSGKWPYKFIDIDLDRLLDYNEYEGFRLGFGGHTNHKISRVFSAGGYFAYGFRDKAFKYGWDGLVNIHRKRELQAGFAYRKDVIESGGVSFFNDRKLQLGEAYRRYLISRMDSVEKEEAWAGWRMFKYAKVQVAMSRQHRVTTNNYFYGTATDDVILKLDGFRVTEIAAGVKYAFREKFMQTPRGRYSLGSDYPVIWVQVSKGLNNFLNGTFDYTRYDIKVEKSFTLRNIGKPSFQLLAGYIDGNLPYTLLYNGRGSYKMFGLSVANSFETMRMNEFLSNRYAAVFFSHSFGNLLLKTERFAPELVVVTNAGWGALNNKSSHHNIDFKTMEKGYYESGLLVNNAVKALFLGIGAGAFYRYGPYAYSNVKDNLAVKFSVTVSF